MKTFPFKKQAKVTDNSLSFENVNYDVETEVPITTGDHPGSFGFVRKYHIHEGVDLYCHPGEEVFAVEDGEVVFIEWFTGKNAVPPTEWWRDTRAVHIEGESGVIVYGEIIEVEGITVGTKVKQGKLIGNVETVLTKDKGRPTTMLHFELYKHGSRQSVTWDVGQEKHESLQDPTDLLISSIGNIPE
ncbi:Peptidase family M23 [compost metagenome]